MSHPRVSIIIATHNAAATLEGCLASIASQSFESWEIVVADGGSSDGTTSILKEHEPIIAHWHARKDNGIYDAWNSALSYARGEYVCFLGADDTWASSDILATIFEAIGDREYDLVTGLGLTRLANGRSYTFGRPWDYRGVSRRMTICHPGALHRRDLFQHFGAFDSSYRIAGDYEFLLRLPEDLRTLHVNKAWVDVADGGISKDRWWVMLRERHRAQSRTPRVGSVRAKVNFVDKLWRIVLGRIAGIPA